MKYLLVIIAGATFLFGGDAAFTFYSDPDNKGTILQEIALALVFIFGLLALVGAAAVDAVDRLISSNQEQQSK